jgi:hypothetical protein
LRGRASPATKKVQELLGQAVIDQEMDQTLLTHTPRIPGRGAEARLSRILARHAMHSALGAQRAATLAPVQ